ncbi:MAG: adenylate/guanylate cyclase domain-containing protein [Alphaproteobacteria bacterium]|jgi:adenylate cyclase|nr:adenylate/guanylate cyclase domain-containing protein [Alphaproteobacteria bacterium]MDP6818833.1 adenylate/guanylate cyclase domain-containing protein [Alphaproteobacteria bacterium]|tara:strand:- start:548 stop:2800 length:2253 start_codon:yes stop_codon:yes gene_type:complete
MKFRFLKRFIKHYSWAHLIALGVLAAFVVLRATDSQPIQLLRFKVFDSYQQITPREDSKQPVVIIDLDDESLAELGQWPWPRTLLAKLVLKLKKSGVVGVAYDIVFAEPDRTSPGLLAESVRGLDKKTKEKLLKLPSNDATFARIMKSYNVVLGQSTQQRVLTEGEQRKSVKTTWANLNKSQTVKGLKPDGFLYSFPSIVRNIETLEDAAKGIGVFTFRPSVDGIVRQVPLVVRVGKHLYPTLALELYRVVTQQPTMALEYDQAGMRGVKLKGLNVPTDRTGQIWMKFGKHDRNLYVSAKDVLNAKGDKAKEIKAKLAGKLAFLGTSAIGLLDIKATPLDAAIPGVEVHAQLLQNILDKNYLARPNWAIGAEIVAMVLVGLLMIILVPFLGALWTLVLAIVTVAILLGLSWWVYDAHGLLLDMMFPAVAIFIVSVVLTYLNYMREERERRQVRGAFSRYMSPDLVAQLAEDPSRLTLGGEMREMSVLFADIRGFTTISEQFDAVGLTKFINRYLTPMTNVILERKGTIDKYMGDCIMAFWNAPLDDPDHAKNGVRSALAMFVESDKMNVELKREAEEENRPYIPLRIGSGVNTGVICVGNMGSDMRFDYSVLGDDVNLGARLEGQSKTYGVDIVIGENTFAYVEDFAVIQLDRIQVKGKTVPVDIYCVLGDEEINQTPEFQALRQRHGEMLNAYKAQDWKAQTRIMDECREMGKAYKLDVLYDLYEERRDEYIANPPGEEWDGVFVATSK